MHSKKIIVLLLVLIPLFYALGLFVGTFNKNNKSNDELIGMESVVISAIKIDEEVSKLLANIDDFVDETIELKEKNKELQKELDAYKKFCNIKEVVKEEN